MRGGKRMKPRSVRIAVGLAGAIVALLVLAQLLGPAIAARIVRGKVAQYGTVHSVRVSAWPAVKLLWREADEVTVHAGRLRLSPAQTVALLKEAHGVAKVSTSAETVEEGPLRLTDTSFEKHGNLLRAQGMVSEADVKRALPQGVEVALVGSTGGAVQVRVSGGLFGVSTSVDAVARAEDGKLVARPTGLLSVLKLTLFENPSLYVEGVSARALGSGPEGRARYALSMWATLR